MNSYYVRVTDATGSTHHTDVEAATPADAITIAADEANSRGALGNLQVTAYEQVGTHNILSQRAPVARETIEA